MENAMVIIVIQACRFVLDITIWKKEKRRHNLITDLFH